MDVHRSLHGIHIELIPGYTYSARTNPPAQVHIADSNGPRFRISHPETTLGNDRTSTIPNTEGTDHWEQLLEKTASFQWHSPSATARPSLSRLLETSCGSSFQSLRKLDVYRLNHANSPPLSGPAHHPNLLALPSLARDFAGWTIREAPEVFQQQSSPGQLEAQPARAAQSIQTSSVSRRVHIDGF